MAPLSAILVFVITLLGGASAQTACDGACYDTCLSLFDVMGGYYERYAAYLRYIRSLRVATNSFGTAYTLDLSAANWQWSMQRFVGYATAVINPSDNDCNPFFMSRYSAGQFTGWCAISYGSWHCKNQCEAAEKIMSDNPTNVPETTRQDYLLCGCANLRAVINYSSSTSSCRPDVLNQVMLHVLYNSNDQRTSSICTGNFDTIVATNVNGPGNLGTGFNNRDLDINYFFPSWLMKSCLEFFCCEGARKRMADNRSEDEGGSLAVNLDHGNVTLSESDEVPKQGKKKARVYDSAADQDQIRRCQNEHNNAVNRGKTAARDAGVDLKGWQMNLS